MPLDTAARVANPRGILLTKVATALPQTATTTYFNVVGEVEITELYGKVTTAIQAQANAIKFRHTPTGGTVADVSGTVDINAAAVGANINVQGPTTAGALSQALTLSNNTGGLGGTLGDGTGTIDLATGALGLNAAASNTGAITWYLRYRPKRGGSYVTVA